MREITVKTTIQTTMTNLDGELVFLLHFPVVIVYHSRCRSPVAEEGP